MKAIEYIHEFISNLDEKGFYITIGATLFIVFFSAIFIMYYTRSHINTLQQQIADINEQRRTIAILLNRYTAVTKQQKIVDELLTREKGFKIGGYFQEVLDSLGLSKYLIQDPRITTMRQDKEYSEVSLTGNLNELSMKQLTDLLQKIAETELVYSKKLEITKSEGMPPAVNVTLTIATLSPTEAE